MKRWITRSFACAAVAIVVSAAWAQDPGRPEEGYAAVRLLHVGEEPAIRVWLGDALAFTDTTRAEVSPYVVVPAGAQSVSAAPPDEDDEASERKGAEPEASSPARVDAPPSGIPLGEVDLVEGSYATLLLDGNAPGGEGEARFALLPDGLQALPPAGRASLRLVHAVPAGPRLALVVRRSPDEVADPAGEPLGAEGGLAPERRAEAEPFTSSERLLLPSGLYDLWLIEAGADASDSDPVSVTLRQGAVYTVFASPVEGDGTAVPLLTMDAGAPVPTTATHE